MKTSIKISMIAALVLTAGLLQTGCKKNSSTETSSGQVGQMELKLSQDYTSAAGYNTSLTDRLSMPGITFADSLCRVYDSMYHRQDTMFSMNYREYCFDLMAAHGMSGSGMMNGGMGGMGGTSGGRMCNFDSLFNSMTRMNHMTTYRMDSLTEMYVMGCPAMGTMSGMMKNTLTEMQNLRRIHMALHVKYHI